MTHNGVNGVATAPQTLTRSSASSIKSWADYSAEAAAMGPHQADQRKLPWVADSCLPWDWCLRYGLRAAFTLSKRASVASCFVLANTLKPRWPDCIGAFPTPLKRQRWSI